MGCFVCWLSDNGVFLSEWVIMGWFVGVGDNGVFWWCVP